MFDKEPVDIFNSEGTDAPEEEEQDDTEDEDTEDEEGDDEEGDKDDEEGDDEDEEGDDDDEDDESGEDDEDDKDEDPKDREINRLKGLLKTKNNALRDMRRNRRSSSSAAAEFKPPYPDLKKVADLPKEEQDAMTDTEKRLHDENILIKERLNDDAKKAFEKEEKEKADGINPDALTEDEASDFVKASAKYLAKGNSKLANQIIRKYNLFKNDGLTEEQIEDRLAEAARLVKGFKAPKEMTTKRGKSVKKTKSNASGDIDSIVKGLDGSGVKKPIAL